MPPDDVGQSGTNGDRAAMPETTQSSPDAYSAPILQEAEVARRMHLLAELQDALAALGVRSVLARNHRLVLRYNRVPSGPSGMTDPELRILAPAGTHIATTDGTTYRLASSQEYPAGDPAAVAALIRQGRHPVSPA